MTHALNYWHISLVDKCLKFIDITNIKRFCDSCDGIFGKSSLKPLKLCE